ncbi:MAG: Jag N-terminal domain-containing protein [Clostridia bacterium]|nr:Jag N-terminal domain-containing protein [Clostridia bacterium]
MIKESIKTAPTIDEAKNAALLELGLTEMDEYQVEVLKTPQKKILGLFGGSPAEVKITVTLPDEPKPAKAKKQAPKAAKPEKQAKPSKKAENAVTDSKKEENEERAAVDYQQKKASLVKTDAYSKAAEYLKSIIASLGINESNIEVFADDDDILFEVSCEEDYGIVIGRRGETLDAIQYLVRMVANKDSEKFRRVSVNIGDYRQKRTAVLVSLAKKNASRAVRTGRSVTLEPMNPYERRIIHTAVHDIEGATSYSTGVDLDRRVVIASENAKQGGSYRSSRGDRQRRPRRESYVPKIDENREKKSDYSSASLYGKIEVKKNEE